MYPRRSFSIIFPFMVLLILSLGWSPGLYVYGMAAATATRTPTAKPTNSFRNLLTPRPTRKATATVTFTPSPSPTPTRTPIPSGELGAWVDEKVDLNRFLPEQPFVVHFNLPMDPNSASGPAVLTYPYLPGKLSWNESNTALTFQPEDGFQPGQSYRVYLDHDIQSETKKSFSGMQSWRIAITSAPSMTGYTPQILELTDRLPVVSLQFDREMDPDSVAQALAIDPPVKYDLRWVGEKLEVAIREPLWLGRQYRFTLSERARDSQGVRLDNTYSWNYRIAPVRAVVDSSDDQQVDLNFNYRLAGQNQQVSINIEPPLEGQWTWVSKQHLRFTSETLIPTGQQYTFTFTEDLKDSDGNPVAGLEPLVFTPQSPVQSVLPDPAVGAWDQTYERVVISFNRPIDPTSLEAGFRIQPEVQGKFSWSNSQRTVEFKPDEPLEENTNYTVTLDASIKHPGGQPAMLKPYSWSFTTRGEFRYSDQKVNFGINGANAQVIDADGRRAIQFTGSTNDNSQGIFTLYRMDLGQFVTLYREHFGKSRWGEQTLIDIGDLEKFSSWPHNGAENGIQETLLPNEAPPGLYLLTISQDGAVQDELFVLITHNTLTVKLSGTRLWVWASDINGESVADLEVRLYMEDGSIMREGSTNEEGIFSTTLPKDLKPLLVVARGEGEDVTASGMSYFWQGGTSDCCWWGEPAAPAMQGEYRAYIYTERPIYKPGQLVNFKAVVRKDDDARYSILPKDTVVQVTIHDARDNQLQSMDMTLSEFGTLNSEFRLAEGAMLGDYMVKFVIGRETFQQAFKVQDYHKPDFQVQIKLDKDFYAQGEEAKVEVDAQYFFGEPVENASITYAVYELQPAGYGWWWQDIQVGAAAQKGADYIWRPAYGYEGKLSSTSTTVDGHSSKSIPLNPDGFYNCRSSWRSSLKECTFAIEVTANDGSNQTVSASKIIKVYNAQEAYTLETGDWRKRPGESFEVTATALLLDGKPAPDREIELAVLGQGKYYNYDQLISSYTLKTGQNGQVVQPISIEEPGYYRLRLTAPKIGDEYKLEVSDWIYISDKSSNWLRETEDSIEFNITADRTEYKPYEKARFLIASSFSGPALITFERGRVIHTKPVVLTAPLTEIETEIIPEDAPNIFVVINAYEATKNQWEPPKEEEEFYYASSLASSRLRTDQVELHVDAGAKALKVTIAPDQERYEPRQEAVFTIKVTDWQDQPVSAELSAALVDEAIFSLSEDLSGDIFDGFYGRRPHTVKTYNSMALSRILYDAGGRGGGGGDVFPSGPRSNFPDTAAWFPVIKTDDNGEARLTVPLPDTLTSWRLTVKAVTASTRVGEASTNIITQKEVQVRPMLPESLAVGDQAELSASVHNYSKQTRDLTVTLESDHLALDGDADQTITLKPGENRLVRWRVQPLKPGEGQVTIRVSASGGEEFDAVQLPLPVHLRVVPDVVTESGDFDRMLTTVLVRPDDALPQSNVELKVSRSIAGSVLDGLEYLTGYPYGCVEQTMSRALPNAVVGRAMAQLGISNPALENQLPELIGAGLQRLYGYQHADGGWGWWFDDASDAYQSAWVVYGLSMTADAGHPVEPKVIERGAEYLKKILEQDDQLDLRTRAYILYALAVSGHGDRDRTLAMAEQPDELDSFSQAGLALALDRLGEDELARAMLGVLDATVVREDGEAKWVSIHGDGHYHDKTMSSTIRSSAMVLAAYIQIDPQNRRISEIVRYLMGQRRVDGWGTTNETAYTVMALTDYLLSQQQSEGDAPYAVLLNGEEISSGVLQPGDKPAQIQIPSEQMKRGTNLLEIRREGEPEGRLYYGISSRMYSDSPAVEAAGAVEVKREYLDKQSKPLATILPGQLVKVRLTVKIPRERASYVMIEDHLPAGLEALNEGLNTTSHEPGGLEYDDQSGEYRSPQAWQKLGYNNKEIRDGRVTFFVTDLEPGSRKTVTFVYLARAVSAGTFTALPAEVQAMYDETLWGRSSSDVLVIESSNTQ